MTTMTPTRRLTPITATKTTRACTKTTFSLLWRRNRKWIGWCLLYGCWGCSSLYYNKNRHFTPPLFGIAYAATTASAAVFAAEAATTPSARQPPQSLLLLLLKKKEKATKTKTSSLHRRDRARTTSTLTTFTSPNEKDKEKNTATSAATSSSSSSSSSLSPSTVLLSSSTVSSSSSSYFEAVFVVLWSMTLVLLVSIGVWGVNVLLFTRFKIEYVSVLQHDWIILSKEEDEEKEKETNHQSHHHGHSSSSSEEDKKKPPSRQSLRQKRTPSSQRRCHRPSRSHGTTTSGTSDLPQQKDEPQQEQGHLLDVETANHGKENYAEDEICDHMEEEDHHHDDDDDDTTTVVTTTSGTTTIITTHTATATAAATKNNHHHSAITWNRLVGLSASLLLLLHLTTRSSLFSPLVSFFFFNNKEFFKDDDATTAIRKEGTKDAGTTMGTMATGEASAWSSSALSSSSVHAVGGLVFFYGCVCVLGALTLPLPALQWLRIAVRIVGQRCAALCVVRCQCPLWFKWWGWWLWHSPPNDEEEDCSVDDQQEVEEEEEEMYGDDEDSEYDENNNDANDELEEERTIRRKLLPPSSIIANNKSSSSSTSPSTSMDSSSGNSRSSGSGGSESTFHHQTTTAPSAIEDDHPPPPPAATAAPPAAPRLPKQRLPRAIPFVDVFFADALCSLSKFFFDGGKVLQLGLFQILFYTHTISSTTTSITSADAWGVVVLLVRVAEWLPTLLAAVPFSIRARQCWIMYRIGHITHDRQRWAHVANAIKYGTSLLPLFFAAFHQHYPMLSDHAAYERHLAILLGMNALYALYWDIVMDWGMLQQPTQFCQTYCCSPYQYDKYSSSLTSCCKGSYSSLSSSSSYPAAHASYLLPVHSSPAPSPLSSSRPTVITSSSTSAAGAGAGAGTAAAPTTIAGSSARYRPVATQHQLHNHSPGKKSSSSSSSSSLHHHAFLLPSHHHHHSSASTASDGSISSLGCGKTLLSSKSANPNSSSSSSSSVLVVSSWWQGFCHAWLRPRLRFGICISASIVLLDCLLRFAWMLRWIYVLPPTPQEPSRSSSRSRSSSSSNSTLSSRQPFGWLAALLLPDDWTPETWIVCTQLLEIVRRALWNLLRVEWEQCKLMQNPQYIHNRIHRKNHHHTTTGTIHHHNHHNHNFLDRSTSNNNPEMYNPKRKDHKKTKMLKSPPILPLSQSHLHSQPTTRGGAEYYDEDSMDDSHDNNALIPGFATSMNRSISAAGLGAADSHNNNYNNNSNSTLSHRMMNMMMRHVGRSTSASSLSEGGTELTSFLLSGKKMAP